MDSDTASPHASDHQNRMPDEGSFAIIFPNTTFVGYFDFISITN